MTRNALRASILGILLVSLAALPAAAQIPPGDDPWVTPGNGLTKFNFPDGDVESLCGLPPIAGWNHSVALEGVPVPGADYDTVVSRLDHATFDSNGVATTRIQVTRLEFASINPQATPCGPLSWRARLFGPQTETRMVIRKTSPRGGIFTADIDVSIEFQATDANGQYIGSLFYSLVLPDPGSGTSAGTPWSFNADGTQFRPGMTETENCIDVLRKKLATYAPDSDHFYYISDMISQGRCSDRP